MSQIEIRDGIGWKRQGSGWTTVDVGELSAEIERLRARIESARGLVEEYDRVASIDHVAARAILWRLTDEQSKEPKP